jgi:uncharacterized MAPEG superfamily protein
MKAHMNNVENLVVFAALVLRGRGARQEQQRDRDGGMVYFWARVVHVLAYTFAVPWVRYARLYGRVPGAGGPSPWQILAR